MYDLCTIEMKFNHFPEYQGHKVIYDVRFGKIRTIGPMSQMSPIVTYNLAARLREGRQNPHTLTTRNTLVNSLVFSVECLVQ